MKNLLIYINPKDKKYLKEHEDLIQIQIDNSLALGWAKKDIVHVTNFPYEYKGIKTLIVQDYTVFDADRSTKIPAINELFERHLIKDDTYWFHDHDAFQLEPFNFNLEKDAGFTDHGAFSKTWNAGSFFFKKTASDIFRDIWHYMNLHGTNEQNALTFLWEKNIHEINNRYEKIPMDYNIGIYKISENLKSAGVKKPKVAHFHPHKKHHFDLYRGYLPDHLLNLFQKYGIN